MRLWTLRCAVKVTEALDNQVPSDQLSNKLWFL